MPKGVYERKPPDATRVNVYLHGPQMEAKKLIENFSAFVQLAVDNAPDIMAWAILKDIQPKKYHDFHKLEDVIDDFNAKYPADPLTQKRNGTWRKNSQKLPDVLL